MGEMPEQKKDLDQNVPLPPLFEANPEAWRTLASNIRSKVFDRDAVVLRHGDTAHGLWLVHKGWVKLIRQTPDGKETVIGLCTEGDVFGEAALFPNASYPYQAEVIATRAELLCIGAKEIQAHAQKDNTFSSTLMMLLGERNAQIQLRLEHANTMSSAQRLGCFLLRLCKSANNESATLQIPIDKYILASYLGMKPETLSRSQQQLKGAGVSVTGASVVVTSVARLKDFVCGSCSESGTGTCDVEADS